MYTIRRRYKDFKALRAGLAHSHPKAAQPMLPSSELKFLVKPSDGIIKAHARALLNYLQQVCASPALGRAGALERFLDASGRVTRYVDAAIPRAVLHSVQSLLTQRLPSHTQLALSRRCVRATWRSFCLEVRMHRQRDNEPYGLLIVFAVLL